MHPEVRLIFSIIFLLFPTAAGCMNRYLILIAALIVAALISAGCTGGTVNTSNPPTTTVAGTTIQMETSMGTITLILYDDMPITAGNFKTLAKEGFYNNTIFHRIIDGFMIQGGDPTGTGRGGPGYTIPDEFVRSHSNVRGTIAMANAGPNTGGSQFFINLVDNQRLDPKHPVFGEVISGMDVVDRIGKVATDSNDRPLQNVTIKKITILE
jgi:peptidylprolyl isomerase